MTYMTEGRNNWATPYEDAMRAAAARVAPARRRLTDHQAEQIVTEEFSARGIDIYPTTASSIAHNLRHPLWPFLHPFRARREGWTWGRPSDRPQEGPAITLEQLMARDARFIAQYEELAVRLRGVSEDEAKQAVERLLRETNQQVTASEVELFTLGIVDPEWAEKDPQRAERLSQQLENERGWEPPE
jgi:hypothetical protein